MHADRHFDCMHAWGWKGACMHALRVIGGKLMGLIATL